MRTAGAGERCSLLTFSRLALQPWAVRQHPISSGLLDRVG